MTTVQYVRLLRGMEQVRERGSMRSERGANVASSATPLGNSIPATLMQFMDEHDIDPKNFEGMQMSKA